MPGGRPPRPSRPRCRPGAERRVRRGARLELIDQHDRESYGDRFLWCHHVRIPARCPNVGRWLSTPTRWGGGSTKRRKRNGEGAPGPAGSSPRRTHTRARLRTSMGSEPRTARPAGGSAPRRRVRARCAACSPSRRQLRSWWSRFVIVISRFPRRPRFLGSSLSVRCRAPNRGCARTRIASSLCARCRAGCRVLTACRTARPQRRRDRGSSNVLNRYAGRGMCGPGLVCGIRHTGPVIPQVANRCRATGRSPGRASLTRPCWALGSTTSPSTTT